MKNPIKLVCAALAATFALASAQATTYYWKPGKEQKLWTDLTNWSTEGIDGADASALPGSEDTLAGNCDYNFDLGGGTYSLSDWLIPTDWNNHYMTIANGSLTFIATRDSEYGMSTHGGQITVGSGASLIFPTGSKFTPGLYSSSSMTIVVGNGGTMSVNGQVRLYNASFTVNSGGNLTFSPSYFRFGAEAHANQLQLTNAGSLSLPNGLSFDRADVATVNAGATYTFAQTDGTLSLGGPIVNSPENSSSRPLPFYVSFSGGTVNVTGDVTFNVTSVTVENSVEFNVASGKTINLSPVTFAAGSSITKTGVGSVVLPTTGATATISAGSVTLNAATYDLSDVTFGGSSTVKLAAMGARIDSADSSIEDATFEATIPSTAGIAVLYSTNPSILQWAKDDLDASVPAGHDLVINGETLSVELETAGAFTISGDITEGTGWGGTVPAAGSDVSIDGDGVVATLFSGSSFPGWHSIEVKNGATLRIEADVADLLPIVLNKNAKLEIAAGATVTLTSMDRLTGVVMTTPSIIIPELVIESGATLNVPGGMQFKNIGIRHFGTIAATSGGRIYFGYASADETTYFAMCSTNATVSTKNTGSYGDGTPCFVYPAVGGIVQVSGIIELDGLTLNRVKEGSSSIYDAVMVGINNPTSIPFEIVFDHFTMVYRGYADFGGAATVTFKNSKLTRPEWQAWSSQGRWNINDAAKVIFDNTEHYYEYPDGNSVGWFSSVSGTEAFVLTNSTVMWSRPAGNGKSTLTVYDSFYDCAYDAYITNQIYHDQYLKLPDLFDGLGELNIPQGSFCAIRALNHVTWDANDDAAERICKVAKELKIVGDGDLFVTNGVSGRYFEVIMQSTNNTCTGTLTVDSPENYDAKLYFANGANWAGTVTAGNVALTNLVDAAAASTNSFTKLDLADGTVFPIRVWKTGGAIVSHDVLNVGEYLNHGGKIELVEMGDELTRGDVIILGTIGTESPVPTCSPKWNAEIIDGAGEEKLLRMRYQSGLSIIFR